jgi:hypothetical protein
MSGVPVSRRGWLGAAASALTIGRNTLARGAIGPETLTFRLRETAGLRRFSYPVHALLPVVPAGPNFRLERDGQPVAAQFRRVVGLDDRPGIALDFHASPGPLETQDYQVLTGEIEPGPEPKRGLTVERAGGRIRVANGSVLAFTIPERLSGLFDRIENSRLDFWAGGGDGLSIVTAAGVVRRLGNGDEPRVTVTRQGPFAVGLRFEERIQPADAGESVRSTVEMTFPNSKSWAQIRWTVDDPAGVIARLEVGFDLKIEGEPTLVDLGAAGTVYGFLRGQEAMALEAGPSPWNPWQVLKGPPNQLTPFARSLPGTSTAVEGWAHVMDRARCTALAVDGFGRSARDLLKVRAGGRVTLARTWGTDGKSPAPRPKTLSFWLHFVTNPVQVGAVTSPQAMLAPLEIAWDR